MAEGKAVREDLQVPAWAGIWRVFCRSFLGWSPQPERSGGKTARKPLCVRWRAALLVIPAPGRGKPVFRLRRLERWKGRRWTC